MLVVVASIKASPGGTACALGLASAWPETARPAMVIETDAAGGDIAAWFHLNSAASVVELAAVSHSHATTDSALMFDMFTQHVSVGHTSVSVIAGATDPRQAASAVEVLTASAPMILNPTDRCVFADVGRLSMDSHGWSLLKHADAAVIVVGGQARQIAHLRPMLTELRGVCGQRLCVAVRPGVYNAHAVADLFYATEAKIPVLGDIPHDPDLSGDLAVRATRRARRSAASAWTDLAARLHTVATPASLAIERAKA
ncbi:MAG: hypothetical protein ACRD0P_13060 [Stackebrandtia sp.]